ncbi:MAG: DUF1360 domain-containing protein [Nitrospirota bacterium]
MEKVIYLSFVTASISFTVTETKLLKPLRQWVKEKSSFLGELISCGYCFSYWVALGLVVIYRPKIFEVWWLLDYFLTALVIAWLSGLQWSVMCVLMNKAGK